MADDVVKTKSYQYVDSYEVQERAFTQQQANYNPVGGMGSSEGRACANCRWFISPARCSVVQGEISPTGMSSLWAAIPEYTMAPMPVIIVKEASGSDNPSQATISGQDLRKALSPGDEGGVLDRIKEFGRALMGNGTPKAKASDAPFMLFKQKDGRTRWIARVTNKWIDREKEIVSDDAHAEYVDWVGGSELYPELWLWHTKGTRFGSTDWVDYSDGFVTASGLIDVGFESLADTLVGLDCGISQGFFGLETPGPPVTTYKYRAFEYSVLPLANAAVWTTNFNVIGNEEEMAFTEKKKSWLTQVAGLSPETVAQLEKDNEGMATKLKDMGIAFKSADPDNVETPAVAAAAVAPAAAPVATAPVAPAVVAAPVAPAVPVVTEKSVGGGGLTDFEKFVVNSMSDLQQAMTGVVTRTKDHNDILSKLSQSSDQKVAEVFQAAMATSPGFRPSVTEKNTQNVPTADDATARQNEFLRTSIFQPLGLVVESSSGVNGQ